MGDKNFEIIQAQEERIFELETRNATEAQTVAIRVKPETDFQFIEYQKQAQEILKFARSAVVTNDAEMKASTNDLAIISGLKKGIEEKRQEYVKPINEHVKAVNDAFKKLTDPILEADKITRDKILAYRAEVERKRQEAEEINRKKEELARLEAQHSGTGEFTADLTPVIVPASAPEHVRTDMGTSGTVKTRKARVIDFKLLPDEYKLPNEKLLATAARTGVAAIPGVEFYVEESLRVTTR